MSTTRLSTPTFFCFILLFSCMTTVGYTDSRDLDKRLFGHIYKNNSWHGEVSRSGPGSSMARTVAARSFMPRLLQELNVKTLLDAPCGDFYWMKAVELHFLDEYIGADIVPEMIEENQKQFGNSRRSFICKDLVMDELPEVDLIFCRDCLQHLSLNSIHKALTNFKKSGSTYLLVSNHPEVEHNRDFVEKELPALLRTREINLMKPPFNFPEPLKIIDEGDRGKVLSLWRIKDIPNFE